MNGGLGGGWRPTFFAAIVVLGGEISGTARAGGAVDLFRMVEPQEHRPIDQGSGLAYGRVESQEGLWLVCDRNSGSSANAVFFFSRKDLQAAASGGTIRASRRIAIGPPDAGWDALRRTSPGTRADQIESLRAQVANGASGRRPVLDLEGITIGTSATGQGSRLFVLAEQPHSLVLELELDETARPRRAAIVACYAYAERPEETGGDANDGLEGIAWAGRPGTFYLAEEGTKPHRQTDTLHFFQRPRVMRAVLKDGKVVVDQAWSQALTRKLWEQQKRSTHTLNAACVLGDQTLGVVDRNGGWIFAIDPAGKTIRPWLNLYDAGLLNLRRRLAAFPGQRKMPYVSIEGMARDDDGDLWMVDDPAMPEGFRSSCLIRLRRPPAVDR